MYAVIEKWKAGSIKLFKHYNDFGCSWKWVTVLQQMHAHQSQSVEKSVMVYIIVSDSVVDWMKKKCKIVWYWEAFLSKWKYSTFFNIFWRRRSKEEVYTAEVSCPTSKTKIVTTL